MSVVDLKQFCSVEALRPYLNAPFSRAGYTWATNGHIMARVALREDVPEVEDAPAAERVWTDAKGEFRRVQPFALPSPQISRCTACDGRGREHECPECTCVCEECGGSGRVEGYAYVTAGEGVTMDRRYAEIIMGMPGVEIEVADPTAERLHFRFEGGEGIVMLMRRADDRLIVADLLSPPARLPTADAATPERGDG